MPEYNASITSIKAFAPATCANVAVGYDLLGFPIEAVGDEVILTRTQKPGIQIAMIEPSQELPLDPDKNVATAVIQKFCQRHQLPLHFSLSLKKGIPIGSGMGGSAASAVAALVALNGFLTKPVSLQTLAQTAIEGEQMVSGSKHGDNVVPCLFGGMTLTRNIDPVDVVQLPIPSIQCVLVHPHLRVDTRDARAVLPSEFPLKIFIQQSANLAGFIAALYQNNIALLQSCLADVLIEPKRAALVKGFKQVKQAALQYGALGASLSGSGPAIFAFAKHESDAETISQAMQAAFRAQGVSSEAWICPISAKGAFICNT